MEKTEKFIVFREKTVGQYLADYKNQGTLAYEANYVDDIAKAATINFTAYKDQKQKMKLLAKAFDCEILVVEATYHLTHLNGEDAKEIDKEPTVNGKSIFDVLSELRVKMGLDETGV